MALCVELKDNLIFQTYVSITYCHQYQLYLFEGWEEKVLLSSNKSGELYLIL